MEALEIISPPWSQTVNQKLIALKEKLQNLYYQKRLKKCKGDDLYHISIQFIVLALERIRWIMVYIGRLCPSCSSNSSCYCARCDIFTKIDKNYLSYMLSSY